MKLLNTLLQYYDNARDHFIPDDTLKNHDITATYRFRLVIDIIIIDIVVNAFFALYYPFFTHFSWPSSLFSTLFCAILLSFHIFLLLRLKQQKTHERTAHLLIASVFIATVVGIFISGGVLNNVTPIFLPLPIILAFLLINKSTGLTYSFLTFAFYIALAVLGFHDYQFPHTIPYNNSEVIQVLLWLFFSSSLLTMTLVYDKLTTGLMLQLQAEQEKQTYLATHDALTDLANRQKFDDRLNEAIHRSSRLGSRVTLLMIDLNKFKLINDSFGHDAGDEILKHVAKQLSNTIRTDDLAARIGGDEFSIILQGENAIKDITALLSRLTQQISSPLRYNNKILTITASIGIASFPDQTKTEEELRRAADIAMYTAKAKGKSWLFFNESLDIE